MPIPSHKRTFVINTNFISQTDVCVRNERGKAIRATHPHGMERNRHSWRLITFSFCDSGPVPVKQGLAKGSQQPRLTVQRK